MPSDISISSSTSLTAIARARATAEPGAPGADPEARQAAAVQVMPNPRLRIDGDLGMVVIEFRDRNGEVANSIPTKKELASYQVANRAGDVEALPEAEFRPRDA